MRLDLKALQTTTLARYLKVPMIVRVQQRSDQMADQEEACSIHVGESFSHPSYSFVFKLQVSSACL